jgi:hypothetical protein
MPLAPSLSYTKPLYTGALKQVLIACANGLFVLDATNSGKQDLKVVENLVLGITIVAHANESESAIYRLSNNAIIVTSQHDKVARIQRVLGIPEITSKDMLPSQVNAVFSISKSLLKLDKYNPDIDTVRGAVKAEFPDATVAEEPLSNWQMPPAALYFTITITPPDGNDNTALQEQQMNTLLFNGNVGVDTMVRYVPLRSTRPGEAFNAVSSQMTRIINSTIRDCVSSDQKFTQEVLDKLTDKLGIALQKTLSSADIFVTPVQVAVTAKRKHTVGDPIKTSTGTQMIVPEYATSSNQPRLACYLGTMSSLGVNASFMPWKLAEKNGVYVKGY